VQAAAERARRAGFGGKLCVHPAQLAPAAAGFRPTEQDVRWAQDVVRHADQSGAGASAAAGEMIDRPVLERAQRILERAAASAE
jgi:citrate lyase subunit beta / citryl-CoA lyase